ncbi:DUF421 domain-containing protein [Sinorhizobium meliloti]|uniref:DUF421 domain-containing protein n=1 Tax=Rhizobium meliloti TaxID=382 RepID=UPI00035EC526|nr:YetF domain-containing protein [Sinorhizobium meliloti]RVP95919.1 DUF421 domain-containing protein [Sinorhizobium meliloti]
MSESMLFHGWESLLRIIIVGSAAYAFLVVVLRVSGKRTLSKMNAFDLVITVALGSTLATVLMDRSVPLADGAIGLALLVGLQFSITWLSVRSKWVREMVKSEPTLLVRNGVCLDDAMQSQRITREEIDAAVRQYGLVTVEEAACVMLETDGSLSVVQNGISGTGSATDQRRA